MVDPTATIGAELIAKAKAFLKVQGVLDDIIRQRDELEVRIEKQGERVNGFRAALLEYVGGLDPQRFVIVDDKIVVIRAGRNPNDPQTGATVEIVEPVKP